MQQDQHQMRGPIILDRIDTIMVDAPSAFDSGAAVASELPSDMIFAGQAVAPSDDARKGARLINQALQ